MSCFFHKISVRNELPGLPPEYAAFLVWQIIVRGLRYILFWRYTPKKQMFFISSSTGGFSFNGGTGRHSFKAMHRSKLISINVILFKPLLLSGKYTFGRKRISSCQWHLYLGMASWWPGSTYAEIKEKLKQFYRWKAGVSLHVFAEGSFSKHILCLFLQSMTLHHLSVDAGDMQRSIYC